MPQPLVDPNAPLEAGAVLDLSKKYTLQTYHYEFTALQRHYIRAVFEGGNSELFALAVISDNSAKNDIQKIEKLNDNVFFMIDGYYVLTTASFSSLLDAFINKKFCYLTIDADKRMSLKFELA